MFPNLTLEAVGLRTVFFHTASTDRAAYIVSAGNVSGLRFALNLHNQINAAPLAVQFCPLDWLGSFVLNSLTTDVAELPGRFLLLFIHKAPLIREPGTAAGGMREISAASLVFAQAPAPGVLALAALNFARWRREIGTAILLFAHFVFTPFLHDLFCLMFHRRAYI